MLRSSSGYNRLEVCDRVEARNIVLALKCLATAGADGANDIALAAAPLSNHLHHNYFKHLKIPRWKAK